jgi:hypothetical protein
MLRTIPDASHVWDVFLHDGALFVSVSSPGRSGCRNLVSVDAGRSWRPVPIEAPEGFPTEAWSRIPVMPIEPFFAWKGRLCGGTMGQLNGRALAVCLNDEGSAFLSIAADAFRPVLRGAERRPLPRARREPGQRERRAVR